MGRPVGSLLCVSEPAGGFEALFREVYLTFHRRDAPRSGLTGASRAVLQHLVLAGPLTVGEMGAHLDRAQSVVSDIVTHLERDGLSRTPPATSSKPRQGRTWRPCRRGGTTRPSGADRTAGGRDS